MVKRKGMDDFIVLLVIGLVIIAVFMIVIGDTQEEFLKGAKEMVITQSYVGGEFQKIRVDVNDAFLETKRGVKIKFGVLESTALGNLIIKWNGVTVFNARPSGLVQFVVEPQYIKGENFLEVSAEGPGLVFWGATQYVLREFQVLMQYGPAKIIPFNMLSSEVQQFDRGEIEFFAAGPGTLTAKLNGFEIFSSRPIGSSLIDFSVLYLNPGNNVLSFSSDAYNSMSGAVFRIYTFGNQLVSSRSFLLTEEQVAAVGAGRGRLKFQVDAVKRPGILEFLLNGQPVASVQDVQLGENIAAFSSGAVAGDNELVLRGSGTWDISSLQLGITPY